MLTSLPNLLTLFRIVIIPLLVALLYLESPTARWVACALFFVAAIVWAFRKPELAGDDPWDAWTLEWSTSSPPPDYNFAEIPEVKSRRPLWDLKHPEDPDWKYE